MPWQMDKPRGGRKEEQRGFTEECLEALEASRGPAEAYHMRRRRLSEAGAGPGGGTPLGRLLESVLANMDLGARLRQHLAVAAWPEIAGPLVASHTWVEGVRDEVLVVAADTPAWAQELHMRRVDLLARLAAQVGEGVIREIHFRSGVRSRKGGTIRGEPVPSSIRLSRGEVRAAKQTAARIDDPELRVKAERAFLALTRMSRWRKETGWRRCARCGGWQQTGRRWCASCVRGGEQRGRK